MATFRLKIIGETFGHFRIAVLTHIVTKVVLMSSECVYTKSEMSDSSTNNVFSVHDIESYMQTLL